MKCSKEMEGYFEKLEKDCFKVFEIAKKARSKGLDPTDKVEITLAKTLSERVIGLISVIVPQLKESKAPERIIELEEKYGILDWRVAFKIAEEIAEEKFCKFKDRREAIEVGIRVGFAYATLGVVSAPIEGFTTLEIKKRNDNNGEYFCLNFAGPVRNAGGTAAAVSVIIGDYLRKKFGYAKYDPTKKEIQRCYAEISDYHERVTNLQYHPSEEESEFLMENLPVEIGGEPSEKFEISNFNLKDIPRIKTNILRSGYCLIHSSCIPLKAPKLWAQLEEWGSDFGLEHWSFLGDFVKLQKKTKAAGSTDKHTKVTPDYTYIKDIVSGRPVLGHPLRQGAFRIRYGRARTSGYSAQAIHPATMYALDNFVAVGTQLKVERPGKATAIVVCDTIEGPIVKLNNGNVIKLDSELTAKKYYKEIDEILYLGDILINYGDFFDRAHPLVPPGYCEEYWALELEKACTDKKINKYEKAINKPLNVTFDESLQISKELNIPLHPKFTYFWDSLSNKDLLSLLNWITKARIKKQDFKIILPKKEEKRFLEVLGIPHIVVQNEYIVIQDDDAKAFFTQLGLLDGVGLQKALAIVNDAQSFSNFSKYPSISLLHFISFVKIHYFNIS